MNMGGEWFGYGFGGWLGLFIATVAVLLTKSFISFASCYMSLIGCAVLFFDFFLFSFS